MAASVASQSGGQQNFTFSVNGSQTMTFSHTSSGSNRILVLSVEYLWPASGSNLDITAVTFNGVALTFAIKRRNGSGSSAETAAIWYLLNPPAVTANIVITYTRVSSIFAVAAHISANAATWQDVNTSAIKATGQRGAGGFDTSSDLLMADFSTAPATGDGITHACSVHNATTFSDVQLTRFGASVLSAQYRVCGSTSALMSMSGGSHGFSASVGIVLNGDVPPSNLLFRMT